MSVEFRHAELDNGLTIIAECSPAAATSAVGFFVGAGARDEAPELMGVSHFLEHMMFKGAEGLSAEELNQAFDRMGARHNAYTTTEITTFYASVLPERLDEAIEITARMLRPALRQDDFDLEKNVILEEIAMYADEPFWVLYERVLETWHAGSPLGHRVLGTSDTIRGLSRDAMASYFGDRYSADNTVVALAGNIDFDACVDRVRGMCGSWEATAPERDADPGERDAGGFVDIDEKLSRAYGLMVADAPAIGDDRRYAAGIAAQALGGPDNSLLHWALVETGLAEDASAHYEPHDGGGAFMISVECDPAARQNVWETVEGQIGKLADSLTAGDIDRLVSKTRIAVTLAGERPGGRMQRLGRQWVALGKYTTLEEELERLRGVTVDGVREVLEAFPMAPRRVGWRTPA